jgi:transketolase
MPPLKEVNEDSFVFGKAELFVKERCSNYCNRRNSIPALQAAKKLKEANINATVVSMHTIKPLDVELLASLAKKCKAIVTVEEHSINGGLGEACASFLLQNNYTMHSGSSAYRMSIQSPVRKQKYSIIMEFPKKELQLRSSIY